jgi:hypothetical protein
MIAVPVVSDGVLLPFPDDPLPHDASSIAASTVIPKKYLITRFII